MDATALAQFGLPGILMGVLLYLGLSFLKNGYSLKIELGPRKK
jgi:hypothetical protein